MLAEQRGEAYANADARVSLEEIAAKQGHSDVSKLTPTDIAIEALLQIGNFVTEHPTIHGQGRLASRFSEPQDPDLVEF